MMMPRALWVPAVFLGLFWAWPMALVLRDAVDPAAFEWAAGPYLRARLLLAFEQAGLSLLFALAAATVLILVHARKVPGQGALWAMHAAPFVMPVFVLVPGLQATLPLRDWSPLVAVAVANAYYNAGLAGKLLWDILQRRPHRLEEAARTLGAPSKAAFWRVSAPMMAPAALAVAGLVFLFCFQSFGVVFLLGQGKVDTLETMLYQSRAGAFPHADRAALLAVLQLAIAAVLLVAQFRLRRAAPLAASPPRPQPKAGPARTIAAWLLGLVWLAPLLAILVGGFRVRGTWTLEPWRLLMGQDAAASGFDLVQALRWSLTYAFASALLAVALAWCVAAGLRRTKRGRRILEVLAALPLGSSSLVLGLGILTAFQAGFGPLTPRSPAFVVIGHALVAFPLTTRLLVPALEAVPRNLDAAASTLGAGAWGVWARVHWPSLARATAAAAGLSAAASLGDFGASLLLTPTDQRGLSMWLAHWPRGFDPLARAQADALAGLLLVLTVLALAVSRIRRSPA